MRTHIPLTVQIQSHLPALRRSLKCCPELLESLAAGDKKASGRVGANVAMVWKLSMGSLYASADVPVMGTRECIQNGTDALREAISKRILPSGKGQIDVEWNPVERSLTWMDNGIGMSVDTILDRFLVLGESGKRDATDSSISAGGFGIAKAVILGTSSSFKWRMHTLDSEVICDGWDRDIEIRQAQTFLQGTRITVLDVSPDYDYWWDPAGGGQRPIEARLRELLAANDLPGIRLTFNRQEIHPLFSRRGGTRIEVIGSWGQGTTATVKAYKRSDRSGAYWIRLGGLFQFKAGAGGDLGVDVVIDLITTVRPGDRGYPLNAGRDSLQGEARNTLRALATELERENLSSADKQEDEVFDAEGDPEEAVSGDLDVLTKSLGDEPSLAGLFDSQGDTHHRPEIDEAGPTPIQSVVRTNVPDDYELDLSASKGRIPWLPKGLQTPVAIRASLGQAAVQSAYEVSPEVLDTLDRVEILGTLTVGQLKVIADEMDRAARSVAVSKGIDLRALPERKVTRGTVNPFGHLGALRVSKINYPKERSRALRRNPRKWLPHLLLWSATLKLMAEAGGIVRHIKPGFILEDGTIGLAQKRGDNSPTVIYIHPDRLAENIEANRLQPIAVAGFLHGVASHELAHADGRMSLGHSESYISAREALGARTAHLMPRLAQLAVKLLKLPDEKDELSAKLARLEKQLTDTREGRDTARVEKRTLQKQLTRELSQCQQQLKTVAESASRAAGSACINTVPPAPLLPDRVTVPCACGREEPPSSNALQVVAAIQGVLVATPPAGVDAGYIKRFFHRYHGHLARIVEVRMPRLSSTERPLS